MPARLDHLVIAARTLAEGQAWLEARLGVPLQPGGDHGAFGTHNLLLSLGPSAYLEVIAINPAAAAPKRPRWFALDTSEMQRRLAGGPQLIHWVLRVPELPTGPNVLELSRGDNRWALTVPEDGSLPLGGAAPSLIYWHTAAPPARLPDAGVRLGTLELGTPNPEALRQKLAQLDFTGRIKISAAPQAKLRATLLVGGASVEIGQAE